jgi:predicted dehydrogenase
VSRGTGSGAEPAPGPPTGRASHSRPRILLIGAGRFGKEHLKEWVRLTAEGEASLAGVVVRTADSARRVRDAYSGPVHVGLQPHLLGDVDGADIVTPSETHHALTLTCLQYTDVLVEKPLAPDYRSACELSRIAEELGRRLMVGHVYRFHPLVPVLETLVAEAAARPELITGRFSNPDDPAAAGRDPRLEFLHYFDLIDLLFGVQPEFCLTARRRRLEEVSLRYPGPMNAVLELGWGGDRKHRELSLVFKDRRIDCDFAEHAIVVRGRDEMRRICLDHAPSPLRSELRAFLRLLRGERDARMTRADTAARIVDVAVRKAPAIGSSRPRVAVIGGGIFGATCAIELGRFCDVTLFERHAELMTEASYLNQWRHHSGFHYPRSPLTVQEVKEARDEFMERYGGAVISDFPSYYCTSAYAREITAERYLAICSANGLNFERVPPPANVLAEGTVSLCLKTDEGVLDFDRLKKVIEGELAACPRVRLRRSTEVVGGDFDREGSKRLAFRDANGLREETFDFVVNATYANRNLLPGWFGFRVRPLRFDLLEMLVLELDLPRVSVTVLDGPFTSLLSMGRGNRFMLSHIHQSVLKSAVTTDGAPPAWGTFGSNRAGLVRHASRYIPAVARAPVVESRYGVRAVHAHSEDFDGRPTVVTDHGFGCWSVLGGKIITCVRNAREIAVKIRCATGEPGVSVSAGEPGDNEPQGSRSAFPNA